ncbi:Ubiquitin carboxyl-terminal hydrolase [Trachipleistophora hominis]|uniref:Ubiquitin carboxyl-terminal hydrolase n=1 Tax=Trachipleistophora hominis TaxID=72359 RepID=L7JTM6_TRAHO|nr:Ubiquitin carboxyl-terminal hydrolase [Trachipleistophora hominis]
MNFKWNTTLPKKQHKNKSPDFEVDGRIWRIILANYDGAYVSLEYRGTSVIPVHTIIHFVINGESFTLSYEYNRFDNYFGRYLFRNDEDGEHESNRDENNNTMGDRTVISMHTAESSAVFRSAYQIDDSIEIEVGVHLVCDYDSKMSTGYVGIRNMGATCYINSLVQVLYNINAFYNRVMSTPTQPEVNEGVADKALTGKDFIDEGVASRTGKALTEKGAPTDLNEKGAPTDPNEKDAPTDPNEKGAPTDPNEKDTLKNTPKHEALKNTPTDHEDKTPTKVDARREEKRTNKYNLKALQQMFYKLRTQQTEVHPDLTFRNLSLLGPLDQHQDFHEYSKKLLDELEHETDDQRFNSLFDGELTQYIRASCGCTKESVEKFNDLQLDVRHSIKEALDAYFEEDELCGDNKYRCDEHGLVDAVKGQAIRKVPDILFVLIKRFSMDWETNEVVKNNGYCEFGDVLEINGERLVLKGVVVHSGVSSDGHYYCYVRVAHDDSTRDATGAENTTRNTTGAENTTRDATDAGNNTRNKTRDATDAENTTRNATRDAAGTAWSKSNDHVVAHDNRAGTVWLKFNDHIVTRVSESEVLEHNRGGRHPYRRAELPFSAYGLFYLKNDAVPKQPLTDEQIARIKTNETRAYNCNILTKESVKGYSGPGFFNTTCDYPRTQPYTMNSTNFKRMNAEKKYHYVFEVRDGMLCTKVRWCDNVLIFSVFTNVQYDFVNEHRLVFVKRFDESGGVEYDYGGGMRMIDVVVVGRTESVGGVVRRYIGNEGVEVVIEKVRGDYDYDEGGDGCDKGGDGCDNDKGGDKGSDKGSDNKDITNNPNTSPNPTVTNNPNNNNVNINEYVDLSDRAVKNGTIAIICSNARSAALHLRYLSQRRCISFINRNKSFTLFLKRTYTYNEVARIVREYLMDQKVAIAYFKGNVHTLRTNQIPFYTADDRRLVYFGRGCLDYNRIRHIHVLSIDKSLTVRKFKHTYRPSCISNLTDYYVVECVVNTPVIRVLADEDPMGSTDGLLVLENTRGKYFKACHAVCVDGVYQVTGFPFLFFYEDERTVGDLRVRCGCLGVLVVYDGEFYREMENGDGLERRDEEIVFILRG